MSRHRAEPDDDVSPPPTSDTGPLQFGQGDWPPLSPPAAGRFGQGPRPDEHPTHRHTEELRREPRYVEPRYFEPRQSSAPGFSSRNVAATVPPDVAHPRQEPVGHSNQPLIGAPVEEQLLHEEFEDPVEDNLIDEDLLEEEFEEPVEDELIEAELIEAELVEDGIVDDAPAGEPADELGLLAPAPATEPGHRRGRRARTPRSGGRRPLSVLVSLGVIAALVTGIFFGGKAIVGLIAGDPAADYSGQGSGEVEVEIPAGASTSRIAQLLADSGVVASAEAFLNAAEGNPDVMNIQPGFYAMRSEMSGEAAVAMILDPAARLLDRATIPEGHTVARTLEALAEQTDIPLADFEAAAATPDQLGLPAWSNGRLEGFLYPSTYDIAPDTTAVDILASMVAQFNQVAIETGLEANAAAVGLSPYEVLVVASLVQSEVTVERERPEVARVIYNRLAQSIPLGIDAALGYELGINGNELTTEVLATDTPYNTRTHLGLPPTPISNPGQPSMVGALNPAPGDWIYYVLQNNQGEHLFTASYEEFLAAKAACQAAGLGCG